MSLIESVKFLADKYADTSYPIHEVPYCSYTEGECGPGEGCLLGQAMQHCGMKELAYSADHRGEMAIYDLYEETNTLSRNDQIWLNTVQASQDRGATWGEALENANSLFM